MNPKMTAKDAAAVLNRPTKQIIKMLRDSNMPFTKMQNSVYFGHVAAKQIFKFAIEPKAIAFQIVKGGTGKTSLASSFAVRANLYGLKVLCIDLDQQGNLTQTFGVNPEIHPVMIDILAEGYSYNSAIVQVLPGLDLISSRIENALLDDAIKFKKVDLIDVYRPAFTQLQKHYDLIVVDCPPNVGQSVAAATLGVNMVVAPVVPENFALAGLRITCNTIKELEESYNVEIPFGIALNKYDARTILSQQAWQMLAEHPDLSQKLLKTYVRTSQEFPNALAKGQTIFDTIKPTIAKTDIDQLVREVIGLDNDNNRYAKRLREENSGLSEMFL